MGFFKISDILNVARSKYPSLSKRITEAEALSRWSKAVGPMIAKHSRAILVKRSVLWVEVDHPIWKSELHHRKHQILSILNKVGRKEEGAPIKDILFLEPRKSKVSEFASDFNDRGDQ